MLAIGSLRCSGEWQPAAAAVARIRRSAMSIDGDVAAAQQVWSTPAELAHMVGVGQAAILNRLRRGTLRGEKRDGRWRIPPDVVDAVVAARRAQAVSSGSLRLLRHGMAPVDEEPPAAGGASAGDVEALERVIAAKDEVIAAKDEVINELRREMAQHRAAMVVFLGGALLPAPAGRASPGSPDPTQP